MLLVLNSTLFAIGRKMEFGVCKKICNHLFFLFATVFASEKSEIFRKTRNAIFAKKDDPTKASCQGTKNFAA